MRHRTIVTPQAALIDRIMPCVFVTATPPGWPNPVTRAIWLPAYLWDIEDPRATGAFIRGDHVYLHTRKFCASRRVMFVLERPLPEHFVAGKGTG